MNQEEIERCFGVEGSSLEQFLQLQEADVVDVAAYPGMFLQVLGGARVESVKQYWRILANVWGKQRDAGTIGPGGA